MTYKLDFTVEGNVLKVEIFGERPKDKLNQASEEAWKEIVEVTREKSIDKLLIISHATGDYPTLNAYQINSALAEYGVQKGWKIAFVNLDKKSFEQVKFSETVAVNRGFWVGIFDNEDDARSWLK